MLRPEAPGQTVISGGDIDNRLKTLFDALRMPLPGEIHELPGEGREPFFCLLQDDSLVNNISITTDLLLGPTNPNEVQLVICQGRSKTLPVGRSKNRPVEKQEVEGLAGSMASGA
jgi:hypothetical protein